MQCGMERADRCDQRYSPGSRPCYAECKDNLPALEEFLTQIRMSPNVKELVIAGDLLDEWFVLAPINTYQEGSGGFCQTYCNSQQRRFDVLNRIIRERKILVTTCPGITT